MAPEQIQNARVGPAADVWALGVVLYEMIAGRRPFEGEASTACSTAILNDSPRPLDQLRPGVHPRIVASVSRALAKDPGARYPSAGAFADELRAIATEREDQTGVLDAALLSAPTPSLAVMPFSDLSPYRDQEWFCEGLAEELITALSEVEGLRVPSRSSTKQVRDLDPRAIGDKLGVQTLLIGSVRKAGERVRITTQLVQAADGTVLASRRYDRRSRTSSRSRTRSRARRSRPWRRGSGAAWRSRGSGGRPRTSKPSTST